MTVRRTIRLIPLLILLLSFATVACQAKPSPTPEPKLYSDTVSVAWYENFGIPVKAEAWNRLVGTISVMPYGDEVRFKIQDPFGNVVLDAEKIKGERSFAIIAAADGTYRLYVANTLDVGDKVIKYSVTVYPR